MPDDARMRIPEYVKRELSEVYLLMDHISDCQDKNLELALAVPPGSTEQTITIGMLCAVPWPFPPEVTPQQKSDQLRMVLVAKDRLAHAAFPASGLSIAFTYLTTAEDASWGRFFTRRIQAVLNLRRHREDWLHSDDESSTMVEFALSAFPALKSKRRWLTQSLGKLTVFLWSLLFLTCLCTWDLAVGDRLVGTYDTLMAQRTALAPQITAAALQVQDSLDKAVIAATQRITDAAPDVTHALQLASQAEQLSTAALIALTPPVAAPQAAPSAKPATRGKQTKAQAPGTGPAVAPSASQAQAALANAAGAIERSAKTLAGAADALHAARTPHLQVSFCEQPLARPGVTLTDGVVTTLLYESEQQRLLCLQSTDIDRRETAIRARIAAWNGLQPFSSLLNPQKLPADDGVMNEQLARVLVAVLNYNILPVLLSALAAAAAGLRALGRKVEANTLLPRDLKLVPMRLALGAFLGAVIGLFISPSGSTGLYTLVGGGAVPAADSGLTQIALSAPTYAFLAGFATERIFSWLDQLIGHVFSFGDPKKQIPATP